VKRHKAVWHVPCPTCKARIGEYCKGTSGTHHARIVKFQKQNPHRKRRKRGSVRTVSGGAFEMNRRKH
jgi:hypothetical protein